MTFQRDTEVYRGDIYYIATGGYVGSEQKAGRPGIIVSNDTANKHSPNVEVVFLTSQEKKPLPTHVDVSISSTQRTFLRGSLVMNTRLSPTSRNVSRHCTSVSAKSLMENRYGKQNAQRASRLVRGHQ